LKLELARFDPEPCSFPKPRVSHLPDKPDISLAGKWTPGFWRRHIPGNYRHFTRGRYALGEAYRLSGVDRDGALFAPAYHCVTMLDPAVALHADILLYPLHHDLSPDLEKLDELLAGYDKPVKALLATHYFGFTKNFTDLKHWCDEHRIVLIEDCSHTLFTETFQAPGTGIFGRFVAASPYKFFACADGGLLSSPDPRLLDTVNTKPAGVIQELRGIKRTLEKCRSSSPTAADIGFIDTQLAKLGARPLVTGKEQKTAYARPSPLYEAAESNTASLFGSRCVVRLASIAENMTCRQNNYRRWADAVAELPNCHALFPDLPENCFPYMFPLHIERPDPHFYWLKHFGVPVWRWDEMAVSDCAVAKDYRHHLLHLPCHQALTEIQMEWMISVVRKTLRIPAQGDQ
jgi:perosamine synthetase